VLFYYTQKLCYFNKIILTTLLPSRKERQDKYNFTLCELGVFAWQ